MALFFILWISGLDRLHLNVFLAIVVIVIGTAVAAYAEVHFTWVGIALITVAETFEAIKSACYQFLLANKSFTMWEGMYFVSRRRSCSLASSFTFSSGSRWWRRTHGVRSRSTR